MTSAFARSFSPLDHLTFSPVLLLSSGKPPLETMGAAFSLLSSGVVLTVLVASVGFAYLFHSGQIRERSPNSILTLPKEEPKPSSSLKKKSKKRQAATKEVETSAAEDADVKMPGSAPSTSSGVKSKSDEPKPTVLSFPTIIPGGFGGDTTTSAVEQDTDAGSSVKPKKKKKKGKSKKGLVEGAGSNPETEDKSDVAGPVGPPSLGRSSSMRKRQQQSGEAGSAGLDDSEAWTRVESRRKPKTQPSDSKGGPHDTVSDAGITTSVTGNSSPATEDEAGPIPQPESSSTSKENRKTLAEKLIPKSRKTGVEDMLEESDQPTVARVMRVQPSPGESPAPGYSWADYEDVQAAAAEDADGEDDGGWGVVKSRTRNKPERPPQTDSQPQSGSEMTKKQRQNAAKREAQKAAKAEAEAQRLATLSKHKRELEKTRITEQYSAKGGSSASVDDKGHLVWD